MCAHPKKAMKVRYREHELIWGGFSDFMLTDNDSEKIEVFFLKIFIDVHVMTLQGEQPERGRRCAKEMREWEPLRVFTCNIPWPGI